MHCFALDYRSAKENKACWSCFQLQIDESFYSNIIPYSWMTIAHRQGIIWHIGVSSHNPTCFSFYRIASQRGSLYSKLKYWKSCILFSIFYTLGFFFFWVLLLQWGAAILDVLMCYFPCNSILETFFPILTSTRLTGNWAFLKLSSFSLGMEDMAFSIGSKSKHQAMLAWKRGGYTERVNQLVRMSFKSFYHFRIIICTW